MRSARASSLGMTATETPRQEDSVPPGGWRGMGPNLEGAKASRACVCGPELSSPALAKTRQNPVCLLPLFTVVALKPEIWGALVCGLKGADQ